MTFFAPQRLAKPLKAEQHICVKTDISSVAPSCLGLNNPLTRPQASANLSRIDAALKRLSTNAFGLCISCLQEIPLSRLTNDPSEPHCAKCAKQ